MCTCYVTRRREPTRPQIPRDLGRAQLRPDATTRGQGVRARTSADPNLNFTHPPKAAPVRTLQVQSRQRAHGSGARLGLSAVCSGQPHTNRYAAPFGLLFLRASSLFAIARPQLDLRLDRPSCSLQLTHFRNPSHSSSVSPFHPPGLLLGTLSLVPPRPARPRHSPGPRASSAPHGPPHMVTSRARTFLGFPTWTS